MKIEYYISPNSYKICVKCKNAYIFKQYFEKVEIEIEDLTNEELEDLNYNTFCSHCNNPIRIQYQHVPYYVNIYICGRAYGGPEEGGWWYNYGVLAGSEIFETRNKAITNKELLLKKYSNILRIPLSGTDEYVGCIVSSSVGKNFPEFKPRYS